VAEEHKEPTGEQEAKGLPPLLKEKELPPKKNPLGYLVSYCDTMTLCLTFFIILSTMAEEQQTLAFQTGIGSFRTAIKTLGLAGILSKSTRAVEKDFLDPAATSLVPFVDKELRFKVDADTSDPGYRSLAADAASYLEKGYDVWVPTGISFEPGQGKLGDADVMRIDRLTELIDKLRGTLQIVGTASPEDGDLQTGYRLALDRAMQVYQVVRIHSEIMEGDVTIRAYRWPSVDKAPPKGSRTVDIIVHRP